MTRADVQTVPPLASKVYATSVDEELRTEADAVVTENGWITGFSSQVGLVRIKDGSGAGGTILTESVPAVITGPQGTLVIDPSAWIPFTGGARIETAADAGTALRVFYHTEDTVARADLLTTAPLPSRVYTTSEDDALDSAAGTPLTGAGWITGWSWSGAAGSLATITDVDDSGPVIHELRFPIVGDPIRVLEPRRWIPFTNGAHIVTNATAGTTLRLFYHQD